MPPSSKLEFRCAELSSKLARAEAREREAKKQTATEEDRAARLKDQAADAERKRVEVTRSDSHKCPHDTRAF